VFALTSGEVVDTGSAVRIDRIKAWRNVDEVDYVLYRVDDTATEDDAEIDGDDGECGKVATMTNQQQDEYTTLLLTTFQP